MNIIKLKSINSTNLYAKENLQNLSDFDVIIADKQISGYGQWGRRWIDTGENNVYMTIVLKPSSLTEVYTNIVRFTAFCLCKIFETYNVVPKIKEPNDIIVNNKKICGILAESVTNGNILKGIVVGIGVNLNSSEDMLEKINQPATSLNIETKKFVEKSMFIEQFLNTFEMYYPEFINKEININSFL